MFDLADLSLGALLLILRISVVFLLYFFLWQVLRVIGSDLFVRTPAAGTTQLLGARLTLTEAGRSGINVGRVFVLQSPATIGRAAECDVPLNDGFLSAVHARLTERSGIWLIEDLDSLNGTALNGFALRDVTELHDGDLIRLGRIELRFSTA
jgi:pSer/pThr/pTyr-binding forkhead associated (FHA) protein